MSAKIYIIENDVNVLYALQNKFSLEGLEIKTDIGMRSIEEVVNKIKAYLPGFIILDLILTYIDGFELLSTIKADNETLSIPIFIFTHLSDLDSKARSEVLGAEYYFTKNDLSIDDFVTKTIKIIENRGKMNQKL